MKILYIASERSRAQVATRALRTISPNVTVLWGSSYERAAFAILENPDLSALIVEVQSDGQGCSYLKQMHGLGLNAPVIMVLPEGAGSPVESLRAGAHAYVAKGPSFTQELPDAVTRTIGGAAQAPGLAKSAPVHVDRRVPRDVGRPSETRQPPTAPAPANRFAQPKGEFDRRIPDAVANKSVLERRVSDLETSFQQVEQSWAIQQAAAAEGQAKLETLLHQEREIRTGLEQKLANAKAALQNAEQRNLSATSATAAQLAERKALYETRMAQAAETQKTLEEQLRQSRQSQASASAHVERLTRREAELSSMLREATTTGDALERRLADLETALDAANERASRDQRGSSEQVSGRQAQLEAQLEQEVQKRRTLEEDLTRARRALDNAEKQHSAAVTSATALWAERQAQFDAELAKATEARNTLGHEARELETALDQARQTIDGHATTVERLTQREAELTSKLAEASAIRNTLERQLADAANASKDAVDVAGRDRLAVETRAADREVEFDRLIGQERATRADVERRLAQVEAALREAEQQHTSAITAAATDRTERQAQFDAELSKAADARNTFGHKTRELEAALDQARETIQGHAATVERLRQRETELTSQLADAATTRSTLERQLADAADAVKNANEGASRARLATATRAAEREAKLDALIQEERTTRADVEQRLAQVEAALQEAQQQHASAMTDAATEQAERQAQFETELSQTAASRDEFQRRFSDAETALAAARRDHAAATTEIGRLTQRESALTSQLAEAADFRSTLERQLTGAADALKDADDRATRDRVAAATRAAEREAELGALIQQERATRADVEQRLAQVEAAFRDAEQQHAAAMTAAATERAERQEQFETELSRTATDRDDFKRRLNETEATLRDAEQQHAAAMAAAATERADRQAQFEMELSQTATARDDFKRRLNETEAALRDAEQQHAAAMTAAATERAERQTQFEMERAERQAQFEMELSQTATARDDFRRRLSEAEAALRDAEQQHASAITAAATERAERQTQFKSELAQMAAARDDFKRSLNETEAALRDAEQQHAAAMTAAATERAERQAQFKSELAQIAAARDDFKRRLNETEVSLRDAEQQHASAMTAAATERAERQAQFEMERAERQARFEMELSQTAASRDEFQRRFSDAEAALAVARHDHAAAASEVERLTQREAELTSQLADAAAIRHTLERQLTDSATALKDAAESANRDRLAAEARAAEHQAEFDALIGHERATRADVEQRLAQEIAIHEALDGTVAEMRSAAANADKAFRHQLAQLESEFAREREANKERQARLLNDIQNLEAARGALDESLTSIREQSRLREIEYQNERDGLQRARLAAETEVRRLSAELTGAQHNLEEARKNFQQTLDTVSSEHADSQAKLVATVADRDAKIEDVEKQLGESRSELRRQFRQAPLALWRCTRDGALTDANRALADLLGYRQPDELRGADLVKAIFESADDLSWLIERCVSTKTRQSVETAWKRKNGDRIVVRLSAVEFAADVIEIAVEDITNVRVLEERLAQSHRMEAVARLASEIAITCGRLLGDVHADGQQWLMAVSDDTALRRRGERLLGEVSRAASYLERLAAHGDEQTSALKPVELNRVLRDLKPVLKHVAGDDVDLELSKTSSALNVDMKADRVERLFVNLASYGRERMPIGGRLKIELATVVVDQKFITDHPNVRRGHHALITVTAMRRATPNAGTVQTGAIEPTPNEAASEKPGVDLGALQELLQECGGHLWLTVDPPGNMVVKIRLPLRVWDDRPHPTTSTTTDARTSRKPVMARWFRH